MTILDDYKHIGPIGDGGFAIVTKYQHLKTRKFFAVKKLKDEAKDSDNKKDCIYRFRREIEFLKELDGCENIIELIAYETNENTNFYIMPCATIRLEKYIAENNSKIIIEERIALFDQILNAIKIAHSKGILHRDIHPSNVLLFDRGDGDFLVKVSDFGLGKNIKSTSAFTKSEKAGYGREHYVAPEQDEKLKSATHKSDQYSLGKLLNFIMTGKKPDRFHECDFTTTIIRATEYNPDSRFQGISEFEASYNREKELLKKTKINNKETKSFFLSDGQYDWYAFHKFAVDGSYQWHVYHDYIYHIVSVLSDEANLRNYYATVGGAIGEFLKTFAKRLDECASTTGWDFNKSTSFGELLMKIYLVVADSRLKAQCLKELWRLGYERNQFGVQRIMDKLFVSIPVELQTEFAVVILESSANIEWNSNFARLRIPNVIERAIRQKANG